MTDFRRRLRAVGARYVVVKNTLAQRALDAGSISALDGKLFKGPIGVVLAGDDPLPAAKVIGEFAKQHQKPEVRAGLVDGKQVEPAYVKRLGELPSREVLLGPVRRGAQRDSVSDGRRPRGAPRKAAGREGSN